jgi:hypothetical protein
MVVALKPRNFALKPRTKVLAEVCPVYKCINFDMPFICTGFVPGFKYKQVG